VASSASLESDAADVEAVVASVAAESDVEDAVPQPSPPAQTVEGCSDPVSRWVLAALGTLFLATTFAQSWGLLEDDTKLPVIMAPLAWIRAALNMWGQGGITGVPSGGVQDEAFGYLFPMAPFFAGAHALHVPVWVSERIWLALLLTIGCWGVIRLAEAMGIGTRSARVLGGLAYSIAPIVVTWARTSSALVAVVVLPWVVLPLVVGSRDGSARRAAARSGVAVALMGGVNATVVVVSALPMGALWLLTRPPGRLRRTLAGWWAVALLLSCFWWAFATVISGKYGYNYLPYTETAATTTSTTSAFEALRGASYWIDYFHITGPLLPGAWLLVSSALATVGTVVVVTIGLVGLARRIPEQLFLVSSLCVGVVAITAGYSGTFGGPFAHLVQGLLGSTLAPLRNVSKFSPTVALPLSLGFVSLFSSIPELVRGWLRSDRPQVLWRLLKRGLQVVGLTALILAAMPFWRLQLYPNSAPVAAGTPEAFAGIPSYWSQTATWLDAHQGRETALLVPGAPFAQYTWGSPIDEPLSVLGDSSLADRSLIPYASNGNTEMLNVVESVLDLGLPSPGLAEFLARSGIDYVVERNDLNLKATGAPPPAEVHQVLSESPGLTEVASFGPYLPLSQLTHGPTPVYDDASATHLRAIQIFHVDPASSEVETFPAADPLVVSGSVQSILQLADANLLNGRAVVLSGDPHGGSAATAPHATWVITDGNQRRDTTFGLIRNNVSYLLAAGQQTPFAVPNVPQSLVIVPGEQHQTVAAPIGGATVSASSFGSAPFFDEPSDGPAGAFDQSDRNSGTAWIANAAANSVGQWISITFSHSIEVSSIDFTRLLYDPQRPVIRRVTITTDRGSVQRSISAGTNVVPLSNAQGLTRYIRVRIDAVKPPSQQSVIGISLGAGISQIKIPGLRFQAAMQVPYDDAGAFSTQASQPAEILFSVPAANANLTLGIDFLDNVDTDAIRRFQIPKAMTATISGTVVPVSSPGLEQVIEKTLKTSAAASSGVASTFTISASSWLGDLPRFRPDNLVDGSASPWIAGIGDSHASLELRWKGKRRVGSLLLRPSAGAAVPTVIRISGQGGQRQVRVPASGGLVRFAPLTTDSLNVAFVHVRAAASEVPADGFPVQLPVGLSAIGVPALGTIRTASVPLSESFSLPCGKGPTFDIGSGATEQKVKTSMTGTLGDLIELHPLQFSACSTLTLSTGRQLFSPVSTITPFQIASVVVHSPLSAGVSSPPRSAVINRWGPETRLVVVGPGPASYLQVADSYNAGWVAKLGNRTLTPVRLDGWEQGWLIPAGAGGTVTMTMVPDKLFHLGLGVGAFFLLLLAGLALLPVRRSIATVSQRDRSSSMWLLGVLALLALIVVAGPLALLFIPLLFVARRWPLMPVIVGCAFLAAGIAVTLHPGAPPGANSGAFGVFAQVASVVTLAALLASVVINRPGLRDQARGQHRRRGGHRRPLAWSAIGNAPVEPPTPEQNPTTSQTEVVKETQGG
jgi:arabinofuranan 3-O-arabinosyltransferase